MQTWLGGMLMHIHECLYIHTHIYVYIIYACILCVYIYICTHSTYTHIIYVYIYVYVYLCIYLHVCVYILQTIYILIYCVHSQYDNYSNAEFSKGSISVCIFPSFLPVITIICQNLLKNHKILSIN